MCKIIINATLTTIQPVSIKLPDQKGHPVMTRGVEVVNGKSAKKVTAYIPATTVRGKLRRLSVLPLMQAAAAAGSPWTLDQVYERMIGQDKESEKTNEKKIEVTIDLVALKKRRKDNHIVDLFGAGLGVKSRLSVGHFLPVYDVTPDKFSFARKDLDSDIDVLDSMDQVEVDKFIDRHTANSMQSREGKLVKVALQKLMKAKETNQDEAVIAVLTTTLELAKSKQDAAGDDMDGMKNSTKRPLNYEAMPAGIELKSRIVIDKSTREDLATLLSALDLFSRTPVLGGQVARGCGEVSGKFDVLDQDGMSLVVVQIGGYCPSTVNWTTNGDEFMRKKT